jgi:glycosyltransferase involved in cell wall biosynthesis
MYTGVCNSNFTKHYIDKSFDTFTQVLYPPTDTENFTPGVKQNTLISLARFSRHLHSKRQDLLIDAFSKLHNQVKDWQLFLVGGSEDEKYVEELRTQSNDLPIRFFINPKASEVKNLLTTSKIFWSATGLGSDATTHPEKMEHFGITVVEAMAAGCVPIVSQMGGHLETVTDSCGFFFNSAAELADKTVSLIKDPKKLSNFSQNAITRSKLFDTTIFNAKIKSLLI